MRWLRNVPVTLRLSTHFCLYDRCLFYVCKVHEFESTSVYSSISDSN